MRLVRFLLEGGLFMDAIVSPSQAADLIDAWESGRMQIDARKDKPRIGGTDLINRRWSIEVLKVIAISAQDAEMKPQDPNANVRWPQSPMSGNN